MTRETRALERSKRRMSCRVHAEGRQHNGIVLDLSGSGLFIQTGAKLAPGTRIDIELSLPDQAAYMEVEVVRRRQVPAQLLTVAQGGIGVRILSAPETYYRFLQDLQARERLEQGEAARAPQPPPRVGRASTPPSTPRVAPPRAAAPPKPAAPAKPPERPQPRFRVRVCQTQGARSRVIDVAAPDAEAASRQVLRELGEEWKLLKVEPI